MSISAGSPERRIGVVPYPEGSVLPPTARDAFVDLVRYLGTQRPREQVRQLMSGMDVTRIVEAGMGMPVRPSLSSFERMFFYTLEYCISIGLVRGSAWAISTLGDVRFDVINRGVFVGEERPGKPELIVEPDHTFGV